MEENKNDQNINDESKLHSSNDDVKTSENAQTNSEKSVNDILQNFLNYSNKKLEEEKNEEQKVDQSPNTTKSQTDEVELDQKTKEEISFSEDEYLDEEQLDSMINPTSIEDSPEKQKRLAELQKKYNIKDVVSKSTTGEYKRQFDFSQNLNVRKFKIKPPKKPIIIGIVVGLGTLIVGFMLTYLIIHRPEPPAYLASIELTQKVTESQYVGETIDLRGINLKCNYSDGKVSYIPINSKMITKKSANISAENVIESYNPQTYVELSYDSKTVTLNITVNTIYLDYINAQIYSNIAKGQIISYENILLTGHTSSNQTIKLDSSKAEYKIDGKSITNENGIVIPSSASGVVIVDVYYNQNGEQFSTTIEVPV